MNPVEEMRRIAMYEQFERNLDSHGFTVLAVMSGEDSAGFSYTVGMHESDGFELITVGLPQLVAHTLLTNVIRYFRAANLKLDHACIIQGLLQNNLPLALVPCRASVRDTHTIQVGQFYDWEQYGVLQLVIPDPKGRLPWEPGYDTEQMRGQAWLFDGEIGELPIYTANTGPRS